MQGVAHERPGKLYMAQPRAGLGYLHPRQLLRVRKGVCGLADAPRLRWCQLRGGMRKDDLADDAGGKANRRQPRLDPDFFCGYHTDG